MKQLAIILVGFGLAACQPSTEGEDQENAAESRLDADDIEGQWRLAGINDEELSEPIGVAVSIEGREILAFSDCKTFLWSYQLHRGMFAATEWPVGDDTRGPGGEPVSSCDRAPNADEQALLEAMTRVDRAERRPDNALTLFSPSASVTLFTQ